MMLAVGCPVSKREWILPHWKRHLEVACAPMRFKPQLVFAMSDTDTECLDLAEQWGAEVVVTDEPSREDQRDWSGQRYREMTVVRNQLLAKVREIEPTHFLSLDSDMLLHPEALRGLFDVLGHYPAVAVGGKAYMSEKGLNIPSYADTFGLRRKACVDVRKVSVIMGIKLMTPAAYQVDYEFHPNGEDVGWSMAVERSGGRLWWDGRTASKHVMNRKMLETVDARVGF